MLTKLNLAILFFLAPPLILIGSCLYIQHSHTCLYRFDKGVYNPKTHCPGNPTTPVILRLAVQRSLPLTTSALSSTSVQQQICKNTSALLSGSSLLHTGHFTGSILYPSRYSSSSILDLWHSKRSLPQRSLHLPQCGFMIYTKLLSFYYYTNQRILVLFLYHSTSVLTTAFLNLLPIVVPHCLLHSSRCFVIYICYLYPSV